MQWMEKCLWVSLRKYINVYIGLFHFTWIFKLFMIFLTKIKANFRLITTKFCTGKIESNDIVSYDFTFHERNIKLLLFSHAHIHHPIYSTKQKLTWSFQCKCRHVFWAHCSKTKIKWKITVQNYPRNWPMLNRFKTRI